MNTPPRSRMWSAVLFGLVVLLAGCQTARHYLDRGVRLEQSGDPEAAVKAYTRAIELEPGDALAYFNRGCAASKLGRMESAVADFSEALELDPDLAAAAMGRAHAFFLQGEYDEAIADFTRTIQLVPDHVDAYLGRGIVNRKIGDDDLALADFDKAVGLDPYSVQAFMSRGNLKAQTGDSPGALEDYLRVIQLDPRSAIAHYNSGIAREQAGDLRGAMTDYQSAAALSPDLMARAKKRIEACGARLSLAVDPDSPAAAPREAEFFDLFSEWESTAPENRRTESEALSRVLAKAGAVRGLSSLIIVRGGRLLAETYFDGLGRNQIRPVRSVTKSVLSLLAGIALREGIFRSLDQPLGDFYTASPGSKPGEWRKTTLRGLMALGAGRDWIKKTEWEFREATPEQINPYADDLAFDTPIDPKEMEIYIQTTVFNANRFSRTDRNANLAANTELADVLSLVLTRASGLSALEFADRYLFRPLGIIKRRWAKTGPASSCGSAGLFLRPLDMAKLGQLVARKGMIDSREYVPPGWIEESLKPHQRAAGKKFGYLWQLETWDTRTAVLATGFGGQGIFCLPELDLVIVTTGAISPQDTPQSLEGQTNGIFAFVRNDVVPALLKLGDEGAGKT